MIDVLIIPISGSFPENIVEPLGDHLVVKENVKVILVKEAIDDTAAKKLVTELQDKYGFTEDTI